MLFEELPAFRIYCCVIAAIFGAVMGSFLHCVGWRIAHNEAFWKGRSHCPACGHTLSAIELIPVFSWLIQRGRCRHCGEKIPVRYPLSEVFFAVVTVLCLLRFGLTAICLRNWIFFCCLFCLSVVDLEIFIIPDSCLVIAALAWIVTFPWSGETLGYAGTHLLAGFIYGGALLAVSLIMDRILQKDTLGGGDIKLFAVCGLYLGLISSLFALLLACVLGLLFVFWQSRSGKEDAGRLPFGPSIALATWIMVMYGDIFTNWYLSLL